MSDEASIDWGQIRKQLDDARARVSQVSTPSPERQKRILQERAHDLAREPEAVVDARNSIEIVEFELDSERYGFELAGVREVCPLRGLTPVPCTPVFVCGIINLRGEIHTVIDLKRLFDLPDAGLTDLNKVLIIDGEGLRLGVLADAICGVRSIPRDALQSSLPTITGIRAEYLKGVTSERLIVLEIAKILLDESILVCDGEGT
jgi:purine-binding chemotaxis protein CheW